MNWFLYCNNDPVNRIDQSGQSWIPMAAWMRQIVALWSSAANLSSTFRASSAGWVAFLVAFAFGDLDGDLGYAMGRQNTEQLIVGLTSASAAGTGAGSASVAQNVIGFFQGYTALLEAMLFIMADMYLP
jgi:hypothetical protein